MKKEKQPLPSQLPAIKHSFPAQEPFWFSHSPTKSPSRCPSSRAAPAPREAIPTQAAAEPRGATFLASSWLQDKLSTSFGCGKSLMKSYSHYSQAWTYEGHSEEGKIPRAVPFPSPDEPDATTQRISLAPLAFLLSLLWVATAGRKEVFAPCPMCTPADAVGQMQPQS